MEYKQYEEREEYEARQINASVSKFSYCKTSYRDVHRYLEIIRSNKREYSEQLKIGPVACLGVRNGREVDLFRIGLLSGWMRRQLVHCLEQKWHGLNPRIPLVESVGRSEYRNLSDKSCIGVEINPYLVAISNDVKDYLNINNANFINSSFEEFHIDEKFDIIFSFANDSTIDDNTKFSFSEYIEKIKNLLKDNGLLIFESQAIDSIMSEQLDEKINYLKKDFIILKRKKVSSEYPKNVPFRDFLIFKNQT